MEKCSCGVMVYGRAALMSHWAASHSDILRVFNPCETCSISPKKATEFRYSKDPHGVLWICPEPCGSSHFIKFNK